MQNLDMTFEQANQEINRIICFLRECLDDEKIVIGLSGGLDSDLTARLCKEAFGSSRMKLFTVIQDDMDPVHFKNAQDTATDLGISLVEINLKDYPLQLLQRLEKADSFEKFRPTGLIDPARIKCSVRTAVFSIYAERGYVVVGTVNRTQLEIGMTMPLGDGASHIMPIFHLYKTQERLLASYLGVRNLVIEQPASSGSWLGAEELEDVSYWIHHKKPIMQEVPFSCDEKNEVRRIKQLLTTEKLDLALLGLSGKLSDDVIVSMSGLPKDIISKLRQLTYAAKIVKHKPMCISLYKEHL